MSFKREIIAQWIANKNKLQIEFFMKQKEHGKFRL